MNNKTSNDIMESEFDMLMQVQGLQPPGHIYENILHRAENKGLRITSKWLVGAMAALVLLLTINLTFAIQATSSDLSDVELLLPSENLRLYE